MGRFMGSFHLLMHANWGHEPTRKRALTPSPSPIRWERVAARPGLRRAEAASAAQAGEGFPLSAFRFPLFPLEALAHRRVGRLAQRVLIEGPAFGAPGPSEETGQPQSQHGRRIEL